MTRSPYVVVRWTHLPTGTTAKADGYAYGRNVHARTRWAHDMARKHLLAKLYRPEVTPIRRSYHLDPPWDIKPFIREGGVTLVEGWDAVQAVLDGQIPERITP